MFRKQSFPYLLGKMVILMLLQVLQQLFLHENNIILLDFMSKYFLRGLKFMGIQVHGNIIIRGDGYGIYLP